MEWNFNFQRTLHIVNDDLISGEMKQNGSARSIEFPTDLWRGTIARYTALVTNIQNKWKVIRRISFFFLHAVMNEII